jgi:hypothetical protein
MCRGYNSEDHAFGRGKFRDSLIPTIAGRNANRFLSRSIAVSIMSIYVCYQIYSKVVLDPLERAAVEALKNIPEEELDDEIHKPIFIPFPGTTKQLKPKPYRGSDPEWQEFIKFSKDQKLAQRVRG